MRAINWHQLTIPETFDKLGTDERGLSAHTAEQKLHEVGPNELQEGQKKSVAQMLFSQFKDVMILILLAAAVISGLIGDMTDTIVILLLVVLNALIGFFQEYRAEKAMAALKKMFNDAGVTYGEVFLETEQEMSKWNFEVADTDSLPMAADAVRAGATDFLGRPVAPERLLEALAAAADRRRPTGELTPVAEKLAPEIMAATQNTSRMDVKLLFASG